MGARELSREIIRKALAAESLTLADLMVLLEAPPQSPSSYEVMAAARQISEEVSGARAEVHAQFALNLALCGGDCGFCSFAARNRAFAQESKLPAERAAAYARQFERDGANAVFVMTTANYDFGEFIELSATIRGNLKPETVMIANVGDRTLAESVRMKETGYAGVYHALRLREGIDSKLDPEVRKSSLKNFKEAGLLVGTCVEPVGPEHTAEELADMILFTAALDPAFSGAARRIAIPGSAFAARGMISELRMAQIVAITRLAMPRRVLGNCTHEPCTLGAAAGANLFWAEVGANPRDTRERTEEGRGLSVSSCREVFREAGWEVLTGRSVFYGGRG